MTNTTAIEITAARAASLRALHGGPQLLVLPNAWDAASARAFASAGFAAIATTSGGVAQALGYEDHEHAPMEEMANAAGRIARAVEIPVTVDFEGGYGLGPEEIARRVIAAGGAGLNLEDSDHRGSGLLEAEQHAQRLAAVKAAARAEGVDLVLNARVDVFIRRMGTPEEQLAEGVRRGRLYRAAGADCIYPIGLGDETVLRALIEAVGVINVNVRRGGPLSLEQAAAMGVRRVSYATSLFREVITGVGEMASDIRAQASAAGAVLAEPASSAG